MKIIHKFIINRKHIFTVATQFTATIFAVLGFVGMFVSFESCFPVDMKFINKLTISIAILLVIWTISILLVAYYIIHKKQYKFLEVSNGHTVYVQYGDLFSENEISNNNNRRIIIIPVNTCFDTIIDDDLITSNSVHGIAMKDLYQSGLYTVDTLNNAIQQNLIKQGQKSKTLKRENKRSGNLECYPVGSVAEIKGIHEVMYFFVALSTLDKELHANTSNEDYVLSLIRLLEYCNKRSQKYSVLLPLIGAGAADTGKTEREILEYITKLIKTNRNLINCDVHIVVRENGKDSIPLTDL